MKPKGVLFSGLMVNAILADQKNQTRRIFKLPKWAHPSDKGEDIPLVVHENTGCLVEVRPTYPVGSKLYVKETWKPHCDCAADGSVTPEHPLGTCVKYQADGAMAKPDKWSKGEGFWCEVHENETHWRPSRFMPRWASRIWLEVTAVRVERLQSITDADCLAEGVNGDESEIDQPLPRMCYEALWESINGKGSWSQNPFVWVFGFRRIERPKDF